MSPTPIPNQLKTIIQALDNVLVIDQGEILLEKRTDKLQSIIIHKQAIGLPTMPNEELEKMGQLNTQLRNSNLFIEIPKNTRIEDTLFIFYLAEEHDLTQRTTIKVNDSSEVKIVEYLYAINDTILHLFSDVHLAPYAKLNHVSINHSISENALTVNRLFDLSERSELNQANMLFSNALTHQINHVMLQGEQAIAHSKTIGLTTKQQEMIIKTVIEHHAPYSEGYIEHYGIASEESTLMFEGVGKIHKGKKRSIAKQSNKGVVIGDKARLDANPLLLIDEYDVEAGHGAAIGQIDELQLYYLMSRGLTQSEAEKLIINGFLAPFKAMINQEQLQDKIQQLLDEKTAR